MINTDLKSSIFLLNLYEGLGQQWQQAPQQLSHLPEDIGFLGQETLHLLASARDQSFDNIHRRFNTATHPHSALATVLHELQHEVLSKHFFVELAPNMIFGMGASLLASVATRPIACKPLAFGLKVFLTHLLTSRSMEAFHGHSLSGINLRDAGGFTNVALSEGIALLTHPLISASASNPIAAAAYFMLARVLATATLTAATVAEVKMGNVLGYDERRVEDQYNVRALTHNFCMDLAMVSGTHAATRISRQSFNAFANSAESTWTKLTRWSESPVLNKAKQYPITSTALGLALLAPAVIQSSNLYSILLLTGVLGTVHRSAPKTRIRNAADAVESIHNHLAKKLLKQLQQQRNDITIKDKTIPITNVLFEHAAPELSAYLHQHVSHSNQYIQTVFQGLFQAFSVRRNDIRAPIQGLAYTHYTLDFPNTPFEHFASLTIAQQNYYRFIALCCIQEQVKIMRIAQRGPSGIIKPESAMETGYAWILNLLEQTQKNFEQEALEESRQLD